MLARKMAVKTLGLHFRQIPHGILLRVMSLQARHQCQIAGGCEQGRDLIRRQGILQHQASGAVPMCRGIIVSRVGVRTGSRNEPTPWISIEVNITALQRLPQETFPLSDGRDQHGVITQHSRLEYPFRFCEHIYEGVS
jgi:hypothetical protein